MQALGQVLQEALGSVLSSVWATSAVVFIATIVFLWVRSWLTYQPPVVLTYQPVMCGDITLESLSKFDGRDFLKPLYFAVRGKVYDVTKGKDFYGPGAGYHIFAGKEVSRALAKMSLVEEDCNGNLDDLTKHQLDVLQDWETKFQEKYEVVGQVVPPKQMTLQELSQYDGSIAGKPMYLAIRGTVFDVTTGKSFYGPDGVYPFAGRECARAFAMVSTEVEDCNDNLEDMSPAEMDSLRDWESRFYSKYPIIGNVQSESQRADAERQKSSRASQAA
ncbi:TPA: hypothetical protein ACH3X2_011356 [Trebouxia sp. C0005]|nr:MAG: heme steroid binding domain-containing [Trebouxia sp. A1-2]